MIQADEYEVLPDDIVQDDEDDEPELPDNDAVPPEAPTEELSALEASARGAAAWRFLIDGTNNVVRMTAQERASFDELLGAIR